MIEQRLFTIPTARISLTAFLDPDGSLSHWEVEGRDPGGALMSQVTLAPSEGRPTSEEKRQAVTEWLIAVERAAEALDSAF